VTLECRLLESGILLAKPADLQDVLHEAVNSGGCVGGFSRRINFSQTPADKLRRWWSRLWVNDAVAVLNSKLTETSHMIFPPDDRHFIFTAEGRGIHKKLFHENLFQLVIAL
jgi:hypothetical protein